MGGLLKVSFPPLCSGELFESWLIWFCHTNHDQTAWLIKELGIDEEVLQGAILTDQACSALAGMSEIAKEDLLASHLTTFADQLGRAYGHKYLIAGGGLNSSHVPYKICPECLNTDERPYIRLSWTLELTSICPVHQSILVFECQDCGKPLRLKLHEANRPVTECCYCGKDCRRSRGTRKASDEVVRFQENVLNLNRHENWHLPEGNALTASAMVRIVQKLFLSLSSFPTHAVLSRVWDRWSVRGFELTDDRFSFSEKYINALNLCAWFFQAPRHHQTLLNQEIQAANHYDRTGMLLQATAAFQKATWSIEQVRVR
jgi:hypothetical protein